MTTRKMTTSRPSLKMLLATLIAFVAITACFANSSKQNKQKEGTMEADSVMRKAVGDSIYSILTESKKVKVEVVNQLNGHQEEIKLSSKDLHLLKFIITSPQNYASNIIVYGKFQPTLTITFEHKKGECIVNYDFGLGKWNICDNKGREIHKFDLIGENMIRLANQLFPGNENLGYYINSK